MNIYSNNRRSLFRRRDETSVYRMFFIVVFMVVGWFSSLTAANLQRPPSVIRSIVICRRL